MSANQKPTVSVIIPVYNGVNYLRSAIDSVLAQTYSDFEIIVINDGSTDETEEICLSYGDAIRYIPKENGGVSTALNVGIRKMRGEYFTWLAHDDMFYPDKLKLQLNALEQSNDKIAIVHGNYDLLNVEHNTVSCMRQEDSYSVEQLTNSVFSVLMTTVHASTPLIHKSHFDRVGLFDETQRLTQDYDLLFRMMRGQKSLFIREPLLLSRLHEQSGRSDERFGRACSEQYLRFADSLTLSEIRAMFDSPRAFYCRIAAMMKARLDSSAVGDVMNRLDMLPEEERNTHLADLLLNGQHNMICIFGAGYQGKLLCFELSQRGIVVDCFCDNDPFKQGGDFDGIPSIALPDLLRLKKETLVIIAADASDTIEAQLKGCGFENIITKKSLDNLILASPPLS